MTNVFYDEALECSFCDKCGAEMHRDNIKAMGGEKAYKESPDYGKLTHRGVGTIDNGATCSSCFAVVICGHWVPMDIKPRYLPSELLCEGALREVVGSHYHTAGNHPSMNGSRLHCVPYIGVLIVKLEGGRERVFSCASAWLDKEGRRIVSGFPDCHDHARKNWSKVPQLVEVG